MGNLENHAERELAAYFKDGDFYGGMTPKAVLELVKVFAAQGHSGMSAGIVIGLFAKVARFEPLGPLTGADDEWNQIGEDDYQNNRCSHVFKKGGQAYDINGVVFEDPSGCRFTSSGSRVDVVFPYTPTTKIVKVDADGNPLQ